tara:strand:- start:647 stop:1357 length:711 start_codon:yes stop_codon:yes gene_type:complete
MSLTANTVALTDTFDTWKNKINAIFPEAISGTTVAAQTITSNTVFSGTVTGSTFTGNGAALTAITGANVTGTVPLATSAGIVTTAAQPNITSVGTLSGLTVTNPIAGSVTGSAATATAAAQPAITSVGTLTSLAVTGNVTANNIVAGIPTTVVSSGPVSAVSGNHYAVDTATQTINLPTSPTIGNRVLITVGNFTDTVVGRGGSNIMSSGTDMTLDKEYLSIQFIYTDTTQGWVMA